MPWPKKRRKATAITSCRKQPLYWHEGQNEHRPRHWTLPSVHVLRKVAKLRTRFARLALATPGHLAKLDERDHNTASDEVAERRQLHVVQRPRLREGVLTMEGDYQYTVYQPDLVAAYATEDATTPMFGDGPVPPTPLPAWWHNSDSRLRRGIVDQCSCKWCGEWYYLTFAELD